MGSDFMQQKKKYEQGIKVKHSLIAVAKSKLNEQTNKKNEILSNLDSKRNELSQKEKLKKTAEENELIYKEEKEKKAEAEKLQKIELCKANNGENCEENPEQIKDEESKIPKE